MAYGIIDRKGHRFHTYMSGIFHGIGNAQLKYNWLIADCVCYPKDREIEALLDREYCWLSGDELTALVAQEDFQWIWGVLCGFEKDVPLSDVLKYPLPSAENYGGYYQNPVALQHPLAAIEIVPSDSSWTLILSRDRSITDRYRERFPKSEDLAESNSTELRRPSGRRRLLGTLSKLVHSSGRKPCGGYTDELVETVISKDSMMRYVILKNQNGLYSYQLEALREPDPDERNLFGGEADSLPARWEHISSSGHVSVFEDMDELRREMRSTPEYKRYFE